MFNKISVMGRLVNDPELRTTSNDVDVTSFRIAVVRDYKNGETDCDFFDVVAWRGTARFVCNYFGKGQSILVTGRLQSRDWEDEDGNKRRNIEIKADQVYFAGGKGPDREEDEDEEEKPKPKPSKKPAPARKPQRR